MRGAGLDTLARVLVAGLAAWRVAFLLARENGPGDALLQLRRKFMRSAGERPIGCVKCVSVWLAVPLVLFVELEGWWARIVCWLAIAGVAALIDEATKPPFEWKETEVEGVLPGPSDSAID